MGMDKNKKRKKKRIGRRRKFDRVALFPHKLIPESIRGKESLVKAIPCKFCQKSYLDIMIEELTRLIDLKESRIAIVDASDVDMSKFYSMMVALQGNKHSFNS